MTADKKSSKTIEFPKEIFHRFHKISTEVEGLLNGAKATYVPINLGTISFQVTGSAPRRSIYKEQDSAAFASFIRKLRSIPSLEDPHIVQGEGGRFRLSNEDHYRLIINEFRPIVYNDSDPIFYDKIHALIAQLLKGTYDNGLVRIRVFGPGREEDKTEKFLKELGGRRGVIKKIMADPDFDFLYNGVLQHSDFRHDKRYESEYFSGAIAMTVAKYALVLENLRPLLQLHSHCTSLLWLGGGPKQGSL